MGSIVDSTPIQKLTSGDIVLDEHFVIKCVLQSSLKSAFSEYVDGLDAHAMHAALPIARSSTDTSLERLSILGSRMIALHIQFEY